MMCDGPSQGAKSTKIHTYMYVYCMGGGIHKVGWMGVLSYGGLLRIKNVEDEVGSLMCFSFSVDFVFFYSFCIFFCDVNVVTKCRRSFGGNEFGLPRFKGKL